MRAINIAKLRIKMLFSSPKNVIIIFILPLIFIYLIGYIYSPNAVNQVPIAIVDNDNSDYSKMLISLIKENEVMLVIETNEENARELIRKNKIEGAYIINEEFQSKIINDNNPKITVLKSPVAIGADSLSEIVASGVVRLQSNSRAANIIVNEYERSGINIGLSRNQLWQSVFDTSESYWYPDQLMKLEHTQIDSEGIESDISINALPQFYAGPFGVILMFLALSLGYVFSMITKEKKEGTLKRLLLISLGKNDILLGYLLSMFAFLAIQGFVLIYICNKVFGISFGITNIKLFSIISLYCIYISSIVLALAVRAKSTSYLNNYYPLIVLLTSMVGGSFWSVELLSKPLQQLARITPQGLMLHILTLVRLGKQNQIIIDTLIIIILSCWLISFSSRGLSQVLEEE